jgi:hypothetical protein
VPAGSPELTFDGMWDLEVDFDYGYVEVSTDGGESYSAIECSDQVEGALGPAFNGTSDGFVGVSCDLSAYAGESVVISFRLVTDGSIFLDGMWVDDVAIDGTVLSNGTLDGWQSPTQFNPIDVKAFAVRLIAYTEDHERAWNRVVRLGPGFTGEIAGDRLRRAIGDKAEVVAAIVTYHDPSETVQQYAPYELRVNGRLQPGGGS